MAAAVQLASIGVPNEYLKRRELRELLFRSEGLQKYIRCARSGQLAGLAVPVLDGRSAPSPHVHACPVWQWPVTVRAAEF